jgi:hypothetical protein
LEIYENSYEQSNIIWAYSDQDPSDAQHINKHKIKGVFFINFFELPQPEPKESDVVVKDHWMNVYL